MRSTETRDWGIWYTGKSYTVAHFLKTIGPESEVRRFTTRGAAEVVIAGSWTSGRYEPRLIPRKKQPPAKVSG